MINLLKIPIGWPLMHKYFSLEIPYQFTHYLCHNRYRPYFASGFACDLWLMEY